MKVMSVPRPAANSLIDISCSPPERDTAPIGGIQSKSSGQRAGGAGVRCFTEPLRIQDHALSARMAGEHSGREVDKPRRSQSGSIDALTYATREPSSKLPLSGYRQTASEESSTARENTESARQQFDIGSPTISTSNTDASVPIFVMMPLDTVQIDGTLKNEKALTFAFKALKAIGVTGVMVDVWWGIVERDEPQTYDWRAYKQLLSIVKNCGLRMQAVMSFHACGPNVGDGVDVPLPIWVREAMKRDPDLCYGDQWGYRNPECLSLWADNVPNVSGRSPLQCYEDFMESFKEAMGPDIGADRVVADCYDNRALLDLASVASREGHILWGGAGPHDSGGYNDLPLETGFFASEGGSWDSEYGHFFLEWYSRCLVEHGDRMLAVSQQVFGDLGVQTSIKCAGVHWWYNSRSHAAELTAGYYNTRAGNYQPTRNGYDAICKLCAKYNAHLNFTCVEMRDCEHPTEAKCGPEGLLRQVRLTAEKHNVKIAGENALCRFDREAYDKIVEHARGGDGLSSLEAFTFLRLMPEFFDEANFNSFVAFVKRMKEHTGGVANVTEKPEGLSEGDKLDLFFSCVENSHWFKAS
ncbi:beta-amylase [Cymbomonas tetramitiformis]|uniref:Beta-amylase n=1 Tax=Cymbomonas tetramitiformis TaxID=36881 RepID=A0AAE0FQZ5_9CHLO|nr:beta-amylase [Cymbomonas tetramitiformis]